ncbi:MAG TPA: hypothetical protein VGG90_07500 [Candidatus Dormibacteraeota bacterium]|jgi:hypothetical protein
MKKTLLAAIAGLMVMACGAVAAAPGSNPSPSPGLGGFDVTVTEKDHAAALHVGQKLEVVLHAASGMNTWQHPTSTDQSILAPIVDPAATAARGVTLAAFEARAPGVVRVNSYAGPVCPSGAACPMYVVVYSVQVTVT